MNTSAKPRVFIGSSVEGLGVAYAVQQNLLHEAEVTVWDQGIFQLSRTTIESLTKALAETDFGIFVFSPDDLVKMRDAMSPSVRDNVLFEFGLFIGKLSRERVFFLIPDGAELHLPTDLLGMTPGKYQTSRSDGSMQAATGAACHQIRLQIKEVGPIQARTPLTGNAAGIDAQSEKQSWIEHFFEERYDQAKSALESEMKTLQGEKALATKVWMLYCDLKKNEISPNDIVAFAKQHIESSRVQSDAAVVLRWEGHVSKAIQLLVEAQAKRPNDPTLAKALADCHSQGRADNASAIAELERVGAANSPDVALRLADILEGEEKKSEALLVIQRCHAHHPVDKALRFRYARLAQELEKHTLAAHLLHGLTTDYPKEIEYWGYLGNSCIQLDLHDVGLDAYRRAEKLADAGSGAPWIVSNIGNLFLYKGLPTEASEYLERALKLEPGSDYAHDRLATAIKNKQAEVVTFRKKCDEGRRELHDIAATLLQEGALPTANVK